jgi:hypothetical protein
VAAFLFSLLSFSSFADCTYLPAYSAPFRASILDLAAEGNDLWAATSYGVQLFDRSVDPPSLTATAAVPGTTRVVRVSGGTVYAGSGSRVYTVRRSGRSLSVSEFANGGGTVNDLLVTPLNLYVATSNGLLQIDLLQPSSSALLPTSSANVTALATDGTNLYVADGDSTVEVFSISIPSLPQRIGTLAGLPRSSSVAVTPGRIYVSDGQSTIVFAGSGPSAAAGATLPFGTTSLSTTGSVTWAAGSDRRIRALDWTNLATPVELFATDIAPSGGTINRIAAIEAGSGRTLVAAGDAGLLTFDTSAFVPPFSVKSYASGATTSVLWADTRLYATRASGGVSEFTRSSSGALTAARQWDARVQTLHDMTNGLLLTSSGKTLLYWSVPLTATAPVLVNSVAMRANVTGAILVNNGTAWVLLEDASLWSVDLSQQPPLPQPIDLGGMKPAFLAHSGSAVALAELQSDGNTLVRFTTGDLGSARTALVAGAATGGIAMSSATIALFTFRGINLIDIASGAVTVLPQSNAVLARKLAIAGTTLLELTDTSLLVWDLTSRRLIRTLPLPADGVALAATDGYAGIATTSGVASVGYASASGTPQLAAAANGNASYKKAVAGGERLYLFDGRTIDIFSTAFGLAPRWTGSVRPAGVIDVAASSNGFFALSSSGAVTAYSRDGATLASTTIDEGTTITPLAIVTARSAVWVAISKGCLVGGCEKKTIVLDGRTLARTASLDGGVLDATSSGSRAYAIFDLPAEVRVYDITDATHPSQLAARATEGTRLPVSVSYASGTVYVLGDKLIEYAEASLTKTAEHFDAYQPDLTGAVSYIDQRVRADANCAVVSGRTFTPQLFALPQWSATSREVPSAVKSVAAGNGRLFLLTEHSLEVWTTGAVTAPPRRRPSV